MGETSSHRSQELARAATALGGSPSTKELLDIIAHLDEGTHVASLSGDGGSDEDELEQSVACQVVIQVYLQLVTGVRDLAPEAEDEAEWWAGVQRGGTSVAYFLLQSEHQNYASLLPALTASTALPQRLARLSHTVLHAMQDHNPPLAISSLRPSLIRQLFPSTTKPSALVTSLFPHLSDSAHATWYLQTPVQLVRAECSKNRVSLEHMRDTYAEKYAKLHVIGSQLSGSPDLAASMVGASGVATPEEGRPSHVALMAALHQMNSILDSEASAALTPSPTRGLFATSRALLGQTLPAHRTQHRTVFVGLKRPSRLMLAWPKLVLGPPMLLLVGRALYRSRQSLWESVVQAGETARSFWQSYVLEPIIGILNTVRTGGDEGMRVISKEGMKSDLDVSPSPFPLTLAPNKY